MKKTSKILESKASPWESKLMKPWIKKLLVFLNKDIGAESPLKFCVDCKLRRDDGKCLAFQSIALIDGSVRFYMTCESARDQDCYCGRQAKHFQPKEHHGNRD